MTSSNPPADHQAEGLASQGNLNELIGIVLAMARGEAHQPKLMVKLRSAAWRLAASTGALDRYCAAPNCTATFIPSAHIGSRQIYCCKNCSGRVRQRRFFDQHQRKGK
jgi:hypothetical protein